MTTDHEGPGPFRKGDDSDIVIIHIARYSNLTWYNPVLDEGNLFLHKWGTFLSQKSKGKYDLHFTLTLVPVYS